ncbi:hypothetical protein EPUL_005330, partial [Erysiphe pulchra]
MQSNNIQTYDYGNNQEVPRTLINPHNRASSFSSLDSAGPESSYTTTISAPYIMGDFELNDICPFSPHEIFSPIERNKQQQHQQTIDQNNCFSFAIPISDHDVECAPQPFIFNSVQLSQRPSEVSSSQPLLEPRSCDYEPDAKRIKLERSNKVNPDLENFSCTYNGCSLRFETQTKLQRHKRESHRNPSAAALAASALGGGVLVVHRNSQSGPHKCERLNPSTGKPCNTVFSRPYDLTRHEDTIHNTRKQRVICPVCEEDKCFSRNDALTRHMRVCHPDHIDTSRRRRAPSS